MARARHLKPSFFTNETLAECPAFTRLMFAGLWTLADRDGKLEDRPKKIEAELFPYDTINCDKILTELHNKGFILRYSISGKNYIKIINFTKHQHVHPHEKASTLPEPAEICDAVTLPDMSLHSQTESVLHSFTLSNPSTLQPEAVTNSDNSAEDKKKYWFAGKVIKLLEKDFRAWQKLYPGSEEQFWKYLAGRDKWYDEEAQPENRSNWFRATSANIEKLRQKPP